MFSKYLPKAESLRAHTDTHTHTHAHTCTRAPAVQKGGKVERELKQKTERTPAVCCQIAAFSQKRGGLRLTDADIKDTLATYFKTKERWIYKAG